MTVAVLDAVRRHDFDMDFIRIGDCFIDMTYGREAVITDETLEPWNLKKRGSIIVSLCDDGRFAILDGGHRWTKSRMLYGDDAQIPAQIFIDLSIEEEADLWTGYNRARKKTTPAEDFHADLAKRDPEALAVQAILDRLGLHFHGKGQPKENAIDGIETTRKLYRTYGANSLTMILTILRDSMGTGEGAIQSAVMKGLNAFLTRYIDSPRFDRAHLEATLATHSAAQIKAKGGELRAALNSGDSATSIGMAIHQFYNASSKMGKKLPPWQAVKAGE